MLEHHRLHAHTVPRALWVAWNWNLIILKSCLPQRAFSFLSLGALSEWLADHPVMINSVLPLVLHALGNPELSVSSVSTLKKICRECKYDLPPYAANIVAVSQVCRGSLDGTGPHSALAHADLLFSTLRMC
jgi:hypothetical protein